MTSVNKQNGSVNIFGLGVRSISQITLESNYQLQQMDKVFYCDSDPRIGVYLESIGAEGINLMHLYEDGRQRDEVYQEICDIVIEGSKNGAKCAYLTPGNPVFLNSVVFKLKESSVKYNIPFFVYSGISSIDTLITDLFLPVEVTGLQCYEATHFVRMQPVIDKRIPLALFQPAVVEATDVRHKAEAYLPGVTLLRDILIKLYGNSQKWIVLRSAISVQDSPIISTGFISELVEKANYLRLGTLLIPGDWNYSNYSDK